MNLFKLPIIVSLYALALTSCGEKHVAEGTATQSDAQQTQQTAPEGMVWIPGGTYWRGNDKDPGNLGVFLESARTDAERAQLAAQHFREERPVHQATVDGFFMDETEVTNAQFAKFVEATGYKTLAEVGLQAEDFPKARAEDLVGGSNVFIKPEQALNPRRTQNAWRWWAFTPGADWRHPQGPGSTIEGKMDHPVVCVNYDDAAAYAKWAGKRLPTEAEWERAARGGHEKRMFIWGESVQKDGEWMANCFQGDFPNQSKDDDGYHLTAPVRQFPANDYGLYDMAGNVWEICSDYFNPLYYDEFIKKPVDNPQGPTTPLTEPEATQLLATGSYQPVEGSHPLTHLRVSRGGSFLCHFSYCLRFRPGARHYHEPLTPAHHTGFRCVMDAPAK